MKTDREILLDLLPGCAPAENDEYGGWAAMMPDGSTIRVTSGVVWWWLLEGDSLVGVSPNKAHEAIAAHFQAWCDLVVKGAR